MGGGGGGIRSKDIRLVSHLKERAKRSTLFALEAIYTFLS